MIVRRERPHPGAQLDAFEEADGWRYTAFATDTRVGQLARLDAQHRAHARVEDRIRCAKDTGLGHFPSRSFAINQAWLNVVMLAVDLIVWTQHLLLSGELAQGRTEDAALPAPARRCPADPRTAPPLAAHPAHVALGQRPRSGLCPTRGVTRSDRLIVDPDTTSGGSYRQNQHAGRITMSDSSATTPAQSNPPVTRSRFAALMNDQGQWIAPPTLRSSGFVKVLRGRAPARGQCGDHDLDAECGLAKLSTRCGVYGTCTNPARFPGTLDQRGSSRLSRPCSRRRPECPHFAWR